MAINRLTTTPAQEARRQRVLRAARQLADHGGYEAVQMREVAARAGVAVGTLYRYFSSKDHLLAEAHVEWARHLRGADAVSDGSGGAVERVVAVLRAAHGAIEREPRLAAAFVMAVASADPAAVASHRALADLVNEELRSAIGNDEVNDPAGIVQALGYVWLGALVIWVNGRATLDQVGGEVERAARLLLTCP